MQCLRVVVTVCAPLTVASMWFALSCSVIRTTQYAMCDLHFSSVLMDIDGKNKELRTSEPHIYKHLKKRGSSCCFTFYDLLPVAWFAEKSLGGSMKFWPLRSRLLHASPPPRVQKLKFEVFDSVASCCTKQNWSAWASSHCTLISLILPRCKAGTMKPMRRSHLTCTASCWNCAINIHHVSASRSASGE